MSYKAKRIVIGVAAAVALFTAASVGTYFYIKGNESAQATENTEQVTEQNKDTNADTNSNNSESTSNDQNNGQTTDNQNRAVDNAGTPAQTTDTTTTRTTTDDDGTRTRTTTNADGTTTTIRMNTDGTTTTTVRNPDGTISSQTTDANVVTEIEEEERLVSKDDWVGWIPEAVPVPVVARIASNLDINKYKLSIVKEVISTDANEDGKYDLGETITYKITVSNIGNTKLSDLKISDTINDKENITTMLNVDENDALIRKIDNITDYSFDLEAGEETFFEYSYTVKEEDIIEGVVQNSATVTNNKVEETTTITTETEEINEDYEVTKVADKKEVKAGDTVTYTIKVKNTGNVTLNDVKVDDDMINLHEVVNGLAPNAETSFTGTYDVTQADIDDQKVITNTVTVGDKTTTEEITPEPANKTYRIEKQTISKPANGMFYILDEVIRYNVSVYNEGNVTLTITVSDPNADEEDQEVTLAKAGDEGDSTVLTFTHKVTEADVEARKVTNTVTGTVPGENPETSEVEDPVNTENKEIEVVKKTTSKPANKEFYVKDEVITYEVTVTNKGNIAQTITVSDPNAEEEDQVVTLAKAGDEGDNTVLTFTHKVTAADVKAGKVTNTVTGTVPGEDPETSTVEDPANEEKPKYPYTVISKVQVIKPVNYILVVDDSTSMANYKVSDGKTYRIDAANTAINAFAKALFTNQDTSESTQLTIVRFYGKGKADAIIEKKIKKDYKESTTYTVPKNTNTPGTNMEAGLVLAETYKETSMENVVIILSDGAINNGANDAATLKAIVNDNNTEIYSIGFGSEAANANSNIYKLLKNISTDGNVHSSDGVDTLMAALTGAAYHTESSNKKETLDGKEVIYTGSTPLNMVTLEYENLMNPITARFNNQTGTYGIFTYSLDNGIYTLSVDFSQYLDKNDIVITYYKKTTQSQTATTETLDNVDSNTSENLNDTSLLPEVNDETSSKDDVTNIQEEPETDKEDKSTTVEEPTNNETVDSVEENNNDNETKKEEDRKENTEVKEDDAEKEKQLASDTKESEEKDDEKLVPEKDADNTATNQTEKTETNEVIEENPNITTTEIIENSTE